MTGVASSPPRHVPSFLSRIGFSNPTARRFQSNVATNMITHALVLSANQFGCKKKYPRVRMHSVRLELTKLIIGGKQTTYIIAVIAWRRIFTINKRRPETILTTVTGMTVVWTVVSHRISARVTSFIFRYLRYNRYLLQTYRYFLATLAAEVVAWYQVQNNP